jgi:hypothetical protein
MYGAEHLINIATLLMPQCYIICLAHTNACKELSMRTQLGLASGPPALTRKTMYSQFTAIDDSCIFYFYLQKIRMKLRSLTLRLM